MILSIISLSKTGLSQFPEAAVPIRGSLVAIEVGVSLSSNRFQKQRHANSTSRKLIPYMMPRLNEGSQLNPE